MGTVFKGDPLGIPTLRAFRPRRPRLAAALCGVLGHRPTSAKPVRKWQYKKFCARCGRWICE